GRSRTPSPPASTTAQIGATGETRSSALGVSRAQAVVGFMYVPWAGTGPSRWGCAAVGTRRGLDFWGTAAIRESLDATPGRYLTRRSAGSLDHGVGAPSAIVCERRGPSARCRARPRRGNIADRPLRRRPGTAPGVDRLGAEPADP